MCRAETIYILNSFAPKLSDRAHTRSRMAHWSRAYVRLLQLCRQAWRSVLLRSLTKPGRSVPMAPMLSVSGSVERDGVQQASAGSCLRLPAALPHPAGSLMAATRTAEHPVRRPPECCNRHPCSRDRPLRVCAPVSNVGQGLRSRMAPARSGNTDGGQDSADHFAPSSHCPSWSSTPAFSGRPSDTENAALEVSGARGGDGQGMEAAENHADARARALGTHSRALPGDAGAAVNDNGPLRAEPGGGGRCRRQTQQCSVLCATAVIFALLAERELPETGKSHRCGGEADIVDERGNDAAVNQRRIMLRGETFIDTRCTPNLRGCARQPGATHEDPEAWGSLPNRRRWLRQWYVQTRTVLTAGQHAELEAAAGVKLGPYFPHNAYLIVAWMYGINMTSNV